MSSYSTAREGEYNQCEMLTDQGTVRERKRERERERVLEGPLTLLAHPCIMEGENVKMDMRVTCEQQNIDQIRAQMLQKTKHFIII